MESRDEALKMMLTWTDVKVDEQDDEGRTGLHYAAEHAMNVRSTRLVRGLLIKGACPKILDNHKKLPEAYTEDYFDKDFAVEIRALLEKDDSDAARAKMNCCARNNPFKYLECIEINKPFRREKRSYCMMIVFYILMVSTFVALLRDIMWRQATLAIKENLYSKILHWVIIITFSGTIIF